MSKFDFFKILIKLFHFLILYFFVSLFVILSLLKQSLLLPFLTSLSLFMIILILILPLNLRFIFYIISLVYQLNFYYLKTHNLFILNINSKGQNTFVSVLYIDLTNPKQPGKSFCSRQLRSQFCFLNPFSLNSHFSNLFQFIPILLVFFLPNSSSQILIRVASQFLIALILIIRFNLTDWNISLEHQLSLF